MKSVSQIINTISYVLIAFVAISLIVSSIMIGIITYISVLERTKRNRNFKSNRSIKKDIARVFNAETFIVGFISGIIGIGITMLLTIPIPLNEWERNDISMKEKKNWNYFINYIIYIINYKALVMTIINPQKTKDTSSIEKQQNIEKKKWQIIVIKIQKLIN